MHGHDGTHPVAGRGDGATVRTAVAFFAEAILELGRIQVVGGGVDIDEDRLRADAIDAAGGGKESVRRGDYRVAAPDTHGHEYGE